MPERAQVSSVEAIESFRSKLILFLAAARPALDEVSSDVMRARMWLETDQRSYWEGQLKKRQRAHEEAQQSIFSTRLSNLARRAVICCAALTSSAKLERRVEKIDC